MENKFHQTMTFRIKASSAKGKVTSAQILWNTRGAQSVSVFQVKKFAPASEVNLEYVWDISHLTAPTWQEIFYTWEIFDDVGNSIRSDQLKTEFSDETHQWKSLSNQHVTVYWYDKSDDFGKSLIDAAQKGFDHVSQATGFTPNDPIRVVVYNDQEDFCSFHAPDSCQKWLGGQTFNGLVIQWSDDKPANQAYLLTELIPHELSHAFLDYWMENRISAVPTWFNEGQAMNNELTGLGEELARARKLAAAGRLDRLANMDARETIGQNDLDLTRDWYAEAMSLVAYLYDKYGNTILGKILTNIKEGKYFEDSLKAATGLSMDEYELAWRKWMGVDAIPPTFIPTATDVPFPPTPTYEPTAST